MRFFKIIVCVLGLGACDFPRPADVGDDAGGKRDAGGQADGGSLTDSMSGHECAPSQALRCDDNSLVRCNADGTGEASERCALGCNATEVRCSDLAPSNGLAASLDMTVAEVDFDLGTTAVINTDDGTVQVAGNPIAIRTTTITQISAPTIRVFIVHSLTTSDVTVVGSNALAIVSNGDIKINGTFAASAHADVAGAGRFNDGVCQGKGGNLGPNGGAFAGGGGGGFGSNGGNGGTSTDRKGNVVPGGARGLATGNAELTPLRGGCDAGVFLLPRLGAGGGAIQLVSRTKISISGVVAANGASYAGGGSGGGILLEAPAIQSTGNVVATGGGAAGANDQDGCFHVGEDGRLDSMPAIGGLGCGAFASNGGNGAARNTSASNGSDISAVGSNDLWAWAAGHGGGGVGRIRINTVSGGLNATGVFSPNPSIGTIATR